VQRFEGTLSFPAEDVWPLGDVVSLDGGQLLKAAPDSHDFY